MRLSMEKTQFDLGEDNGGLSTLKTYKPNNQSPELMHKLILLFRGISKRTSPELEKQVKYLEDVQNKCSNGATFTSSDLSKIKQQASDALNSLFGTFKNGETDLVSMSDVSTSAVSLFKQFADSFKLSSSDSMDVTPSGSCDYMSGNASKTQTKDSNPEVGRKDSSEGSGREASMSSFPRNDSKNPPSSTSFEKILDELGKIEQSISELSRDITFSKKKNRKNLSDKSPSSLGKSASLTQKNSGSQPQSGSDQLSSTTDSATPSAIPYPFDSIASKA